MSGFRHDQPDLETIAEAVVFEHELDAQALGDDATTRELWATAALAAAALAPPTEVPATLRARLAADGLTHCAATRPARDGVERRYVAVTTSPRPPVVAFLLGAAAAAVLTWLLLVPPAGPTPAELRQQVLAELAAGQQLPVLQQRWQPGPSPLRGDVVGDVVWRQDAQDGWLTFRGLPELEDGKAYQLWIVDGEREGAPVDGGVFTIADGGRETVVPIHAKLRIGKPAAFVITIEDRAGVVVSKQEHVVAIAAL